MSFINRMRLLLDEAPPEFVFEFSEAGIAWARKEQKTRESGFLPLDMGVLSVSPVRDNVLDPLKLEQAILSLVPQTAAKKRRPAAIILPDYCGRVAVLDFDSFPSEPQEQMALVRFRAKKSVPFDLEAASVSFAVQPGGGKKKDVLVAVVSLEILARYEAPVRVAGLHPGLVTISALAALNLMNDTSLDVTAKLSGKVLSVIVSENNAVRMVRCVELEHISPEDITSVLFPTFAFVEDELKRRPGRLILCGFGSFAEEMGQQLRRELNTEVDSIRSIYGPPSPFNAGLLGYLQSKEAA